MDFLIFSLPRSGSAWLSNFLTYDDVFCHHDPFRGTPIWPPRRAPISGVCDTGAYLLDVRAPMEFVIFRDIRNITKSLAKLNLPTELHLDIFGSRTKHAYPIHFSQMFNVDYLEDLWYNFSTSPFNRARAEMLINMNIQQGL